MATLTCGSVNFGDDIFENSFPIMRGILKKMEEYGVRPELEIFDKGHLANARRLARERLLAFPQHVDFVLGVPGGLEATVQNLGDLVDDLPAGCTWSVAGIGRQQLPMAMAAIAMGGHVRVGLEDNLFYSRGGSRATRSSSRASLGSPPRSAGRSRRPTRRANSWAWRCLRARSATAHFDSLRAPTRGRSPLTSKNAPTCSPTSCAGRCKRFRCCCSSR